MCNSFSSRNDGGELEHVLISFVDITELKQSENKLRQVMAAVGAASDAIGISDAQGRHFYQNNALSKLFGYQTAEELQAAGGGAAVVKDPGVAEEMFDAIMRGKSWAGELDMVTKEGRVFPAFERADAIKDESGNVIGLIGIISDITERKEIEAALLKEKELSQRYLDVAAVIIVSLNANGDVTLVNQKGCDLLGYEEAEIVGKNWFSTFIPEGIRDGVEDVFRRLVSGDVEPVEYFENAVLTRSGEERLVAWRNNYVRDEAGLFLGAIASGEDITERKRLEEQLQQSQKMEAIGTLAGGIAHDFNNILGAVLGYTELTLIDDKLDDESRENLKEVLSAAKRARELVKQILMFSRKSEETREPVKIHSVVNEACKLLRNTIPTSIGMNLDIDKNTGTVACDATQIHQIVMNLCTNAYQAIGGGEGELSISLRSVEVDYATAARYPDLSEGRHALLTVRDTGEGMDALTLSRAYDPFFTTKGTGEGTGLGLAVVHGIVKSHKGSIAVESELGTGTTFLIYLPQVSSDEATETAGRPAPLSGNEHILFVDDEVALAKLGKKMLEQLGYHVTLETVAHRGINTFRAKPEAFDLIITDQTMPGMTGDRLAREAKDIRADIPVMICTGYSDMLNEAKAEEIGVNAFLMKPLERAVLARTVREVLEASTGSCTRR